MATVVHGVEYIVDRAWVGMFESELRGHPTKFHAEQAADLSLDNEHRIAAMCTRSPSGAVGGRHSAHGRRARPQRWRGAITQRRVDPVAVRNQFPMQLVAGPREVRTCLPFSLAVIVP